MVFADFGAQSQESPWKSRKRQAALGLLALGCLAKGQGLSAKANHDLVMRVVGLGEKIVRFDKTPA